VQTETKIDTLGMYERIWRGSMPGYISSKYPNWELFYSSYLQFYIQWDIGDMVERVDALLFADFVRAAACRAGQMLNTHAWQGRLWNRYGSGKRQLHPFEIKKSASPKAELASAFKVLDTGSIPRGIGAILCMKEKLSTMNKQTLIVPIWMI